MKQKLLFLLALWLSATEPMYAQHSPVKSNGNIAVGINHRDADSLLVSSLNLGLFSNTDVQHGVQVGALTSVVRRDMSGVNIGGLFALTSGNARGLQFGGAVNSVGGHMRGLQVGLVSNIAKTFTGFQISGFSNISATPCRGTQISAISNISMGVKRGIQISALVNVSSSYMRGLQIGGYNYADTLNGSQIGFINVCFSHPRGVQVGIFNYSRDTVAHKVGLVNINPKTRIDAMIYGGTATKTNFALRFRNRSTYNIIGVGTHYMGIDEDFSAALFYRIGQYFQLSPRWSVSGDVGFYHIETFHQDAIDTPERLYSLQMRVNVDYKINPTLGAFASVGYGDTRYYIHNREYRNRAIVETGISLRYHRKK